MAIRDTGPKERRIRDTGAKERHVDPEQVRQALGAEDTGLRLPARGSPAALHALRDEIHRCLRSTGGRPGLEGATTRHKVPMRDEEWIRLGELAATFEEAGVHPSPSPAQLASVLLRFSLEHIWKDSLPAYRRLRQELDQEYAFVQNLIDHLRRTPGVRRLETLQKHRSLFATLVDRVLEEVAKAPRDDQADRAVALLEEEARRLDHLLADVDRRIAEAVDDVHRLRQEARNG